MKKRTLKTLLIALSALAIFLFFSLQECKAQSYSFGIYAFADSTSMAAKLPSGTKAKFAYTIDDSGLWFWDGFDLEWKRISKIEDISSIGGSDNISFSITDGGDSLSITDGAGSLKVAISDIAPIQSEIDGDLTNELQVLDVSQLNGDILELSISLDGEATKTIDLSPLKDDWGNQVANVDGQTVLGDGDATPLSSVVFTDETVYGNGTPSDPLGQYLKVFENEFIDTSALIERDTFDPSVEVSVGQDFGIIPKMIPDPFNGKIYNVFRVGTNHLPDANMIIALRESVDGGVTFTGIGGSGTYTEFTNPFGGGNRPDCSGGAVTPTGRLVLFIREFSGSSYVENYVTYSDDGGATFSTPTILAGGGQIGYMYDTRFMIGERGELIFGQRVISTDRYIDYYHSFDNGATWSLRSRALNNSDTGYNFGEVVTRDAGNGMFVSMVRLAANNQDGENLPFVMVSRDYGRTWGENGDTTLSFTDIYNRVADSGFLPLEGRGVTLGGATSNESVLPSLEIVDYNSQKYMVVPYYIRFRNSLSQDTWKVTALKLDEYLSSGISAIDSLIPVTIFQGNAGGINQPDGNGCFYTPKGRVNHSLWTTGENIGTGSAGGAIIVNGSFSRSEMESLLNSLDGSTSSREKVFADSLTGWQYVAGDDYTTVARLSVTISDTSQILINGNSANLSSQLPTGVTEFWSTTGDSLAVDVEGDAYELRLDFMAEPQANDLYMDLILDIGDGTTPNYIIKRNVSFNRGSGNEVSVSVGFPIFTGSSFKANGGKFFIDTFDGTIEFWDFAITVIRVHRGK